jgi:hypothetical protein
MASEAALRTTLSRITHVLGRFSDDHSVALMVHPVHVSSADPSGSSCGHVTTTVCHDFENINRGK